MSEVVLFIGAVQDSAASQSLPSILTAPFIGLDHSAFIGVPIAWPASALFLALAGGLSPQQRCGKL